LETSGRTFDNRKKPASAVAKGKSGLPKGEVVLAIENTERGRVNGLAEDKVAPSHVRGESFGAAGRRS